MRLLGARLPWRGQLFVHVENEPNGAPIFVIQSRLYIFYQMHIGTGASNDWLTRHKRPHTPTVNVFFSRTL